MIIKKIIRSLAFLMSLSFAAEANEVEELPSTFYLTKDGHAVKFESATHIQNLENHFETNKETYIKVYKKYLDNFMLEKTPNIPGTDEYALCSVSFGVSIACAFAFTNVYLSKKAIAFTSVSCFATLIMLTPTEANIDSYGKAKEKLKSYVIKDLYNQRLIKIDYGFFSNDSEQVFNKFVDNLTNPSAPKQ